MDHFDYVIEIKYTYLEADASGLNYFRCRALCTEIGEMNYVIHAYSIYRL